MRNFVRLRLTLAVVPVLVLAGCAELPEVDVVDVPDVPTLESLSEGALEGADGVAKVLEEQYHLTDVGSVDCPPNVSLSFEKGATFDCTVVIAGEERTVEVSVLNAEGGIQVSEPR
ncbi:DUF4333 domain-containing protein [Actinophytocola glycyrrhizae]|uniref:DUF4333 domain-containing protein n=1 Tax=Actinophytocola glycyrrhizae TaxID=2044873 RepID=A0ABV9RV82_9PSEU